MYATRSMPCEMRDDWLKAKATGVIGYCEEDGRCQMAGRKRIPRITHQKKKIPRNPRYKAIDFHDGEQREREHENTAVEAVFQNEHRDIDGKSAAEGSGEKQFPVAFAFGDLARDAGVFLRTQQAESVEVHGENVCAEQNHQKDHTAHSMCARKFFQADEL